MRPKKKSTYKNGEGKRCATGTCRGGGEENEAKIGPAKSQVSQG